MELKVGKNYEGSKFLKISLVNELRSSVKYPTPFIFG